MSWAFRVLQSRHVNMMGGSHASVYFYGRHAGGHAIFILGTCISWHSLYLSCLPYYVLPSVFFICVTFLKVHESG